MSIESEKINNAFNTKCDEFMSSCNIELKNNNVVEKLITLTNNIHGKKHKKKLDKFLKMKLDIILNGFSFDEENNTKIKNYLVSKENWNKFFMVVITFLCKINNENKYDSLISKIIDVVELNKKILNSVLQTSQQSSTSSNEASLTILDDIKDSMMKKKITGMEDILSIAANIKNKHEHNFQKNPEKFMQDMFGVLTNMMKQPPPTNTSETKGEEMINDDAFKNIMNDMSTKMPFMKDMVDNLTKNIGNPENNDSNPSDILSTMLNSMTKQNTKNKHDDKTDGQLDEAINELLQELDDYENNKK